MKILVLGGTKFVGRTFTELCLSLGHEITLFNRGQSAPGLFKGVDEFYGDRATNLSPLDGLSFDAVFDTSGYVPRVVEMSAAKLSDNVGRYLFVSSISVYKDASKRNQNEDGELADGSETLPDEVTPETYGPLKVQCEEVVESIYGNRATIVRPGLIVGPYDTTDRFTYWPVRFSRGGQVLVPDLKAQPVQFIDVRDLVAWCLDLLERHVPGRFNATGPNQPYRFGEVIEACSKGTNSEICWVEPVFLENQGVMPWSDLPLALPADGSSEGFATANVERAISEGLKFRSLADTVADTRAWALTRDPEYPFRAGLTPNRESSLLEMWRERMAR